MTSFVIACTNKVKRRAYIDAYCHELRIDKYDVTLIEKDNQIKTNVQSIGIDEIKNLHKKIFLKPINSEVKAVIIEDAELLTTEAQNALLKVLEEPPSYTIIMLGTTNLEALLPTILSRCQIITLTDDPILLSAEEKTEYVEFIEKIHDIKIGEKLKLAEELSKDKEKAISWIVNFIVTARELMLNDEKNRHMISNYIYVFQELHMLLKTTNVNVRFAIESTLLQLHDQ